MRKTNIGISDAALACLAYLLALFGGYTPLLLVVGYVLIKEKNDWLRFSVVKATLLSVCFTVTSILINLLPNLIGFINSICNVFEGSGIRSYAISNIANALDSGLNLTEKVFFILLAVMSIKHGTLKLGFIDKLAEKIVFGSAQTQQPAQQQYVAEPVPQQTIPQPIAQTQNPKNQQ